MRIAGVVLRRVESPPSLACWAGDFPEPAGAVETGISLVIEPAAPPEEATLHFAHDIVSRFDVFADQALEYCRTRLRESHFELTAEELAWLDLPELPHRWALPRNARTSPDSKGVGLLAGPVPSHAVRARQRWPHFLN